MGKKVAIKDLDIAKGRLSEQISDELINYIAEKKLKVQINAGTGTGKTYLIQNIQGQRVLILTHRLTLLAQIENDIKDTSNIEVKTYHAVFNEYVENGGLSAYKDKYDIVVFDEYHFLIDDSVVNENTYLMYRLMYKYKDEVAMIFMSATPKGIEDDMFDAIFNMDNKANVQDRIEKIHLYRDMTNMMELIGDILENTNDKIYILARSNDYLV